MRRIRRTTALLSGVFMAATAACGTGGEPRDREAITLAIGGPHAAAGAPWVQLLRDEFIPTVQKRVEAETPHRIEFTQTWGGSVAKIDEVSEAIQNRILDIGYITAPAEASKLPLHNYNYWLPFGPADPMQAYTASSQLYQEFPILSESLEKRYNQKYLGFSIVQNYGIVSTFPIQNVEDIQGHKVAGIGPNLDYIKNARGVGVTAAVPDMYSSIQTGVFDGMIILPQSIVGTKMWEVAKYWNKTDFGSLSPHILTVNLDTWNELPAQVRKILEDAGQEWSRKTAEDSKRSQNKQLERWRQEGGEIVTLPAKEQREWASRFPVDYLLERARKVDAKSLPGSKVISAYVKFLKKEGYVPARDWKLGES